MRTRTLMFAGLSTMALVGLQTPAAAVDGSRDPMVVAQAAAADPGGVLDAFLESDGTGTTSSAAVMAFTGDDHNGFPTGDDDAFMGLATGDAAFMNDGDQTYFASGYLGGMFTNRGTDLAGMTMEFTIPEGTGPVCFVVDLKFLSEEFPEYVGSSYNDFVAGRINDTAPPTIADDNTPVAPGNFLRDGEGAPLTVNNNYNVNAGNADQTVYDGASPILQARTEVPDGDSFTFSLWIADVGDSNFDSAVFVNNARVLRTSNCESGTSGPSETTLKVKVGKRVKASGTVVPSGPGQEMVVTLFKKVGGQWTKKQVMRPLLSDPIDIDGDGIAEGSRYATTLKKPGGSCKVKAKYPGDSDTYPSVAQKTFNC
ncbi:MAG: choice-of-anchor L domain-containing protein [Actinobacteria bacterium]|nr:choice-of-anchor L domain-containing protein [Actinomycetota bacterium]